MIIKYKYLNIFKAINRIVDCVFPRSCKSCTAILNTYEQLLCLKCNKNLHYYDSYYRYNVISSLQNDSEYISVLLCYHKHGVMRRLIHSFKYESHIELGRLFAGWQIEQIIDIHKNIPIDYVVPVPMHSDKLRKRGYNQVVPYAKTIAELLGVPYTDKILKKSKNTKTQSKQNAKERMLNISGSFDLISTYDLNGKHLLITDDIITTGATMLAVINMLKSKYNCKISIAAIAVTVME